MPTLSAPKGGVFAALWISTDARLRLRKRALAAHLAFLRRAGVDGVLALGSTGEFPRFSLAEREQLLTRVAEGAGSLTVLANISSIRLDEAVALGKHARRLGLPAIALMPPTFFPVSQADMLEFFLRVADAVQLPVYLYNFPELTSNRIGIETVAKFAAKARLAGIKQSGGEFGYIQELATLGRTFGFAVFAGADTRLQEAFALGASGCIGGLANFVPEAMVAIYRACQQQPQQNCARDVAFMKAVGAIIDRLTFPLNVAAGLEARGFDPGEPKTVVSQDSAQRYRSLVRDLRRLLKKEGIKIGDHSTD